MELPVPRHLPPCVQQGSEIVVVGLEGSGGSLAADVPAPGHAVHAHVSSARGAAELHIATRPSGEIVVSAGEEVLPPGGSGGGPPGCEDNDFTLSTEEGPGEEQIRWYGQMNWRFKASSRPTYLTAEQVESGLREATTNITHGNNNCGIGDAISATSDYKGTTTNSVNAENGTNSCNENGDGISVVAFGGLAGNAIGLECTWSIEHAGRDEIVESDVRLEAAAPWTVSPGAPNCAGSYSIEAVMTHERGHSFGLGHVSEEAHANLTMSTRINGTCNNSEASLGLGDMNGLEALY
jgi:hypothetical protein